MNIIFLKSSHRINVYATGFQWLIWFYENWLCILKRFRIHIKLVPNYEYIILFKLEFFLSFNWNVLLRIFNIFT